MARFTVSWEEQGCGKCGQPLQVRLTRQRTVFSVAHGKFVALERQGHCPQHPHLPPARSRKLPRIVAPGCKMSYDVIARVGLGTLKRLKDILDIVVVDEHAAFRTIVAEMKRKRQCIIVGNEGRGGEKQQGESK